MSQRNQNWCFLWYKTCQKHLDDTFRIKMTVWWVIHVNLMLSLKMNFGITRTLKSWTEILSQRRNRSLTFQMKNLKIAQIYKQEVLNQSIKMTLPWAVWWRDSKYFHYQLNLKNSMKYATIVIQKVQMQEKILQKINTNKTHLSSKLIIRMLLSNKLKSMMMLHSNKLKIKNFQDHLR